jgi:nucleoside-diphosphate-sugar epimerase
MKISGTRFLVTGGTGFIGSALVRGLLDNGGIVRTFDNDSRQTLSKIPAKSDSLEIVTGDIRDPKAVSAAVKGVDCVCHLAYINGTEYFYTKPELVLDVAVKGMVNVLDACIEHNVREFVLASSSEVYQQPPVVPTPETVPLIVPDVTNPRYSYGGGKIICELMAINYGRTHFDRTLIFRPHNVYGPDMGWEHVIPQFALRIGDLAADGVETVDFPIQGSGDETRSFIFVTDMIAGLIKVIENGEKLGIYHLGTENEITVKQLAEAVADQAGVKIRVVPGELRAGGTPRRCPDISRARALGFEPSVSLEEGLKRTVSWYLANADKRPPAKST